MTDDQRQYYYDMKDRGRAYLSIDDDGHIAAIVTFFIGNDDNKYLYGRDPWTVLEDEPDGETVYIDQLIAHGNLKKEIYQQFKNVLTDIKNKFTNVKQAKWVRAPAGFRKHKIREGKPNVHCKNIA